MENASRAIHECRAAPIDFQTQINERKKKKKKEMFLPFAIEIEVLIVAIEPSVNRIGFA